MSPPITFINSFGAKQKCPCCKRNKLSNYSLCSVHLEAAKVAWRKHQDERRAEGRCCYCHRKSYKGFLRCRHHTIENRVKCRKWTKKHGHQRYLDQKAVALKTGVCYKCRKYPVKPGTLKCDVCHLKLKKYQQGRKRIR